MQQEARKQEPSKAGNSPERTTTSSEAIRAAEQMQRDKDEAAAKAQAERQKIDSPEEKARKSVAQDTSAPRTTEETELSSSRSRTQNPAGGHTPEQLIHERKSDL